MVNNIKNQMSIDDVYDSQGNKIIKNEGYNIEEIEITEDEINDENKNSKNKIDYEEKLKEIDELKDKVNELTDQFADFYKMFKQYTVRNEFIDKVKENKPMFDAETGKKIKYGDTAYYEEIEKRSNYSFNSRSTEEILKDIDKKYDELQIQNNNVQPINSKLIVRQKELPFWDKTGSVLGGAIGGLFAGVGGLALGMKVGKEIFDSKENENTDILVDERRLFLEKYPVRTYEEFIERLKAVDPNTNYDTLSDIEKDKDANYYNEVILSIYDDMKSLEYYKVAKTINENKSFKYGLPYVHQDFSVYTLSNDLKNILKSRGLSLEKLGELINVSKNTMTAIVNNKNTSSENMFKISVVLQLPIENIFRYELILDKYIREFLEREALKEI